LDNVKLITTGENGFMVQAAIGFGMARGQDKTGQEVMQF